MRHNLNWLRYLRSSGRKNRLHQFDHKHIDRVVAVDSFDLGTAALLRERITRLCLLR